MKNKGFNVIMVIIACICVVGSIFAACNVAENEEQGNDTLQGISGNIHVISREEGSGTRDAFIELMEITDAEGNDIMTPSAEITSSTAVMLKTVASDERSIGYVSLGSLSEDVKAVSINSTNATPDTVKDGSYMLQRPFILAYKQDGLSSGAADFIKFVMSSQGQQIIEEEGYIGVENGGEYTPSNTNEVITISGSTSVAPVMEVLADSYKQLNHDAKLEIQQPGSGAGIEAAISETAQIAMSSRELDEEEKSKLVSLQIAKDGIAVIVNRANQTDNLTSEQVKAIFSGETAEWESVKE